MRREGEERKQPQQIVEGKEKEISVALFLSENEINKDNVLNRNK